jgi:hypothetical protein
LANFGVASADRGAVKTITAADRAMTARPKISGKGWR